MPLGFFVVLREIPTFDDPRHITNVMAARSAVVSVTLDGV